MKVSFKAACFLTAIGIASHAFGHHSLRGVLTDSHMAIFETASRYLLLSGIWFLALLRPNTLAQTPLKVIFSGAMIFCGSLLLYLVLQHPLLMMITPLGGVMMIAGFVYLGVKS